MREPVRDRERLEHIKDAIERIQDNIKTVSLDNLSSNVLVFYGIVKNIEIIGEAARIMGTVLMIQFPGEMVSRRTVPKIPRTVPKIPRRTVPKIL